MNPDNQIGPETKNQKIKPTPMGWKLATFRSRFWLWTWIGWSLHSIMPLLSGWLLKLIFDRLSQARPILNLVVALGIAETAGILVFAVAVYFVVRWWVASVTLLRTNMLNAQTVAGGPDAATLPSSPAEATSRFSEDADSATIWADSWVDATANGLFGVGAVVIMATINPVAALVALGPLAVVGFAVHKLTPMLYAARSADRVAASRLASLLGELFAGQLAFNLAGKEESAIKQIDESLAKRHRTAVRDSVITNAVESFASSTNDVIIGVTLLVLVPLARSGQLSVGDLALFAAYASRLGLVPRYVARVLSARQRAIVSFERMGQLVATGNPGNLVAYHPVTIEPNDVMLTRDPDPARTPLQRLEIRGLTALHPNSGVGVFDIDLTIDRGEFVVVTGPLGGGKTTLLRALAGLMGSEQGEVRWNGELLEDHAAWFVPPNAAYMGQVPNLFSETISSNITLGRPTGNLDHAIELASLTPDLDDMVDGLNTVVGSRGFRLSGGQSQRVAAARCLITNPELLLVDDLSSALDVATEHELWTKLAARRVTIVAVTQREMLLKRADQVITMQQGRVVCVERRQR